MPAYKAPRTDCCSARMRVLIVKLSSLGDVVHAMPALQDIRRAFPRAVIDWVVEDAFAPLVRRCDGIDRVIVCNLRAWRRDPWSRLTRMQSQLFAHQLREYAYDAILDLQGLTKSACMARMARTTDRGRRFAMAHRTEGSSYEAPTRWLADVAIAMKKHVHAIERSRILCARALDYSFESQEHYGLQAVSLKSKQQPETRDFVSNPATVMFAHGSSRADKQWPVANWVDLGRRFNQSGLQVAFPHGSQAELQSSQEMAGQLQSARVLPRLSLDELADAMACCVGVIGVDSGLSHVAVALDLLHVQIYNLDTAWRTGPVDRPRQRSLYATPFPSVDAVWQAWQGLSRA